MLPSTLWNGCMMETQIYVAEMQGKMHGGKNQQQSDDNEIIKNKK